MSKVLSLITDYKDYYMRYLQPVPDQMQNISCFLPSMISYNARALNASSIDIMERISWLNSQQSEKIAHSSEHNIVNELSKFSLENKTQTSAVSVLHSSLSYSRISCKFNMILKLSGFSGRTRVCNTFSASRAGNIRKQSKTGS